MLMLWEAAHSVGPLSQPFALHGRWLGCNCFIVDCPFGRPTALAPHYVAWEPSSLPPCAILAIGELDSSDSIDDKACGGSGLIAFGGTVI